MSRRTAAVVAVAIAIVVVGVLGGIETEFWRGFWAGITLVLTPSLLTLAWLLWDYEDEG